MDGVLIYMYTRGDIHTGLTSRPASVYLDADATQRRCSTKDLEELLESMLQVRKNDLLQNQINQLNPSEEEFTQGLLQAKSCTSSRLLQ